MDETLARANEWLKRGYDKYIADALAYRAAHHEEYVAERDAWFAARRRAIQEQRANEVTRVLRGP